MTGSVLTGKGSNFVKEKYCEVMDREKVIKEWESVLSRDPLDVPWDLIDETVTLLKEQEIEEPHPWEHIWDAPDYTFKGRCRNCGFIHYFVQGHDAQYRFCPQCGEQKVI